MQVNEKINITNLLSVGTDAKKGKTDKLSEDFASVFQSVSNQTSPNEYSNEKMEGMDVKTNSISEKDSSVKQEVSKSDIHKSNESDSSQITEDVEALPEEGASQQTSMVDSSFDMTDEDNVQQMMELFSTIFQVLSDKLEIPVEELAAKMDELGMQLSDLLDSDKTKDLFLSLKGFEVSDLLTNEELVSEFNDLSAQLDLVMESFETVRLEDVTEEISIKDVLAFRDLGEDVSFVDSSNEEPIVIFEKETVSMSDNSETQPNLKDESNQSDFGNEGFEKEDKGAVTKNPILHEITNSVDNVLVNAVDDALLNSVDGEASVVDGAEIVKQIVEQIKVSLNQDSTSIQMQLYPEHLGKIQINIVSKEGIMTAHIVAENEAAKQAIEGGLASLKEAMENQNIKVEAIEVMVSTTGFANNNESQNNTQDNPNSSFGKNRNISGLDEENETEDAAEIEKMKASGSSVSYSV